MLSSFSSNNATIATFAYKPNLLTVVGTGGTTLEVIQEMHFQHQYSILEVCG